MTRISGIKIENDSKGVPAFVRIDLKKHKEILVLLEQKGAIELEPEINPADYITSDELMKRLIPRIEKLFEK
ncbi:MAG: hypothetical protein WCH34_05515 [Bacteroidota bacterium]